MNAFLYKIPAEFLARFRNGDLQLFGAILKDAVTGRIVGQVQETGALDGLLRTAFSGLSEVINNGLNPVSAATGVMSVVQNHQIRNRLIDMQASLGLLQNLQLGTLAVSGLGLGVSVAGFAVMIQKLGRIS